MRGVTGVTEVTLEKRKLVKEKNFTKVGRTDGQQGENQWKPKAEMSKNIVQGTTHQSVDRLHQCVKHDGSTSYLTLNLAN